MGNENTEMLDYIEGAASLEPKGVVYLGKPCNGSWSCGGGCYGSIGNRTYSAERQSSIGETSPLAAMTSDLLL
ncbi:hypothetical protein HY449_04580 [Candidatus Pacearchaeota archaeon]|nr:hypothetical protein [Candidatus Pacearchaeota archaeon]